MGLSNKQIHEFVDFAAHQWNDRQTIVMHLERAQIDVSRIELYGPSNKMWHNAIRRASDFNQLEDLVDVLIEKLPNNQTLAQTRQNLSESNFGYQITNLKNKISAGNCVLFLGPNFLKCMISGSNIPFQSHFSQSLTRNLNIKSIFFDDKDASNLSYMIDRFESSKSFAEGDTEREAAKVYHNNIFNVHYYDELMRLNFPLIINTNPDTILKDKYPQKCTSGFYDISNGGVAEPFFQEENKRLVYNIFGSFENPFSILFTEASAVDFTKRVYNSNPEIPEVIRNIIRSRFGIFVGFDFKEWHLKILFDVLELKDKPGNYAIAEPESALKESDMEYYQRRYNMSFVSNDVLQLLIALR